MVILANIPVSEYIDIIVMHIINNTFAYFAALYTERIISEANSF